MKYIGKESKEYFEEEIKTENDDEENQKGQLSIHSCKICQEEYKSKDNLYMHTNSVHTAAAV